MMAVVVPLAGFGRRFREEGFQEDKPLIPICGRAMLEWALDPLEPLRKAARGFWPFRVLGVVRRSQAGLLGRLEKLGVEPVVIDGPTQGAACTVLAAAVGLAPDCPVAVMNCDQWFECDLVKAVQDARADRREGFILTFPGTGPAWSYCVTNGADRVVHVIEKKQVSPHATVGFYWWRRADLLVESVCRMIGAGCTTKGEYYLAPSYNFLPLDRRPVSVVPVERFEGMGTPEQLREFILHRQPSSGEAEDDVGADDVAMKAGD